MNKRTCSVAGCEGVHDARGLCRKHYYLAKKQGTLPEYKPLDTTWAGRLSRIGWTETEGGCWEWAGAKDKAGYGILGRTARLPFGAAHRASYEVHYGPIPERMVICHSCDNPPCINPDHLFAGSYKENYADMVLKGRGRHGRTFQSSN